MSEQIHHHPILDPHKLARLYADPEYQQQQARLNAWFDGSQQNAQDFLDYTAQRPAKEGHVPRRRNSPRSSDTGPDYEAMTLTGLASELAKAEVAADAPLQGHLKAVAAGKIYNTVEAANQRDSKYDHDRSAYMENFLGMAATKRRLLTGGEPEAKAENPGSPDDPDSPDKPGNPEAATDVHEAKTKEAPAADSGKQAESAADAPSPEDMVAASIDSFNQKFADPTYVPSPQEYRDLRTLAGHVRISHRNDYGENRIAYFVGDKQLPAFAARKFLDNVNDTGRWRLAGREAGLAEQALAIDTKAPPLAAINMIPDEIREDATRQERNELLHFYDFRKRWNTAKGGKLTDQQAVANYLDYLEDRLELEDYLNGQEGIKPVTPRDVAMDALALYARRSRDGRLDVRTKVSQGATKLNPKKIAKRPNLANLRQRLPSRKKPEQPPAE